MHTRTLAIHLACWASCMIGNGKELIAGGKKLIELYNEDPEPSFFEELVNFAVLLRNCNAVKLSPSKRDTTSMKLEPFQYFIRNELAEVIQMFSSPTARIYHWSIPTALASAVFISFDGWNHALDLPWAWKDCKVLLFCMLHMLQQER